MKGLSCGKLLRRLIAGFACAGLFALCCSGPSAASPRSDATPAPPRLKRVGRMTLERCVDAPAYCGRLERPLDPTGAIGKNIPCERVIGCVVYPASELLAPGVIKQIEGNRFPVGDLDGSESERVKRVSECFIRGGMQAPVLTDIRAEMWLKLWGNMTFNPMSALSRGTLAGICQYPPTRELARAMMTEAQAIATKLGITFRVPIEKRIAGAERVGHHKTSMLQDVEAGRPLETDALLGSVIELGRMTGTPTPHLDAVFALTKLLEQSLAKARAA